LGGHFAWQSRAVGCFVGRGLLMKKSWKYWARLGFTFVMGSFVALTVLMIVLGSVELNNLWC
jgi:hypothetical protein